MSNLHRRTGVVAVALAALLMSVAAACSSSTEGSDPTTTLPTASGTVPPDDEEDDDTGGQTGTTVDEPRTGTSLIDDDEDPPTGDETEEEYVAALVSTFEEDPDQIFTREDVQCLAEEWVPAIGVETFQAAGVTPADLESGDAGLDDVVLDRETAEAIVDAIPGCGLPLIDLFIDGLGSEVADDPTKVACVEGAITDDEIRESLIADIMGAEPTEDPEDLVGQCLI